MNTPELLVNSRLQTIDFKLAFSPNPFVSVTYATLIHKLSHFYHLQDRGGGGGVIIVNQIAPHFRLGWELPQSLNELPLLYLLKECRRADIPSSHKPPPQSAFGPSFTFSLLHSFTFVLFHFCTLSPFPSVLSVSQWPIPPYHCRPADIPPTAHTPRWPPEGVRYGG